MRAGGRGAEKKGGGVAGAGGRGAGTDVGLNRSSSSELRVSSSRVGDKRNIRGGAKRLSFSAAAVVGGAAGAGRGAGDTNPSVGLDGRENAGSTSKKPASTPASISSETSGTEVIERAEGVPSKRPRVSMSAAENEAPLAGSRPITPAVIQGGRTAKSSGTGKSGEDYERGEVEDRAEDRSEERSDISRRTKKQKVAAGDRHARPPLPRDRIDTAAVVAPTCGVGFLNTADGVFKDAPAKGKASVAAGNATATVPVPDITDSSNAAPPRLATVPACTERPRAPRGRARIAAAFASSSYFGGPSHLSQAHGHGKNRTGSRGVGCGSAGVAAPVKREKSSAKRGSESATQERGQAGCGKAASSPRVAVSGSSARLEPAAAAAAVAGAAVGETSVGKATTSKGGASGKKTSAVNGNMAGLSGTGAAWRTQQMVVFSSSSSLSSSAPSALPAVATSGRSAGFSEWRQPGRASGGGDNGGSGSGSSTARKGRIDSMKRPSALSQERMPDFPEDIDVGSLIGNDADGGVNDNGGGGGARASGEIESWTTIGTPRGLYTSAATADGVDNGRDGVGNSFDGRDNIRDGDDGRRESDGPRSDADGRLSETAAGTLEPVPRTDLQPRQQQQKQQQQRQQQQRQQQQKQQQQKVSKGGALTRISRTDAGGGGGGGSSSSGGFGGSSGVFGGGSFADGSTISGNTALDTIVTSFLRNQHERCPDPVCVLPPLSLSEPHRCPERTPAGAMGAGAPPNVTKRVFARQAVPPVGGRGGARLQRAFVHSRFRRYRSIQDPDHVITASTFARKPGVAR